MKTEWLVTTLGELVNVKHGWAFKGEYFAAEGDELVLTPGNFPIGGGLKTRAGKDRYYTSSYPTEFLLAPGDLLVVMTDLTQNAPILGSPAVVPSEPRMLHNQRLGLVTVKPGVFLDRRFLYYLLLSDGYRSQLRATATGTTVRHTAPERIYRVSVALPPKEVQHTVGAILGVFDELIESNRRRVEVLEEMARAMYREWFVHFRYPGHENANLVDSPLGPIPDGWDAAPLGSLAREIRTSVQASDETAALPYVPIDVIDQRSVTLRMFRPGREAATSLRLFERGDVLFGAMRAYFHKVCIAPFPGVTRSTCLVLRPTAERYEFSIMTLADDRTVACAAAHSFGSTIPYAKWATLSEMMVAIPPTAVATMFGHVAGPLLSEARSLAAQAECLGSLRNLLLPKLVSGQIDVSALDLDGLVEGSVA